MFSVEFRHYIWKDKLWLLVLLFCVCKFISMQFETVYVDTHIIDQTRYQTFFEKYQGRLSLDKKEKIKHVDNVLKQYVSYADENPAKHYLVNETGWDAWIGNEKFDVILLAFIVFFAVYLVSSDYETGVYALKYTSHARKEKIYLSQQMIFVLYSAFMILLSFACEWIFYGARYGLSGYHYPVQSLWTFENSPFSMSIWGCCISIHILKGIGIIFMGEISYLLGKYIGKLWLSFFAGMAVTVVPYMIFNREQVRYYIQPLGMILGNGYFRGKCKPIMYDGVEVSEPVGKIPQFYLPVVLGAVILVFAIMFIILFWNLREKCVWMKKCRLGFLFSFVEVLLISSFCLVLVYRHQNVTGRMKGNYYQGEGYSDANKIYTTDEENRLIEYDYLSKKQNFIIRDVFKEKNCDGYYVDKNAIYYYVKDDYGEVSIYKTNKTDFTSEIIYKEINGDRKYAYTTRYLGLINVHNYENASTEKWQEENIKDFWVDGKNIFLENGNSIEMVDLVTKDRICLVKKGYQGGAVAYHAGTLYYIDSGKRVVRLDVVSQRADFVDIPKCRTLAVQGKKLWFITEKEEVGVYYDGEVKLVSGVKSAPTSNIVCGSKDAFFISKNNKLQCIDSVNLRCQKVQCYDDAGNIVNESAYNVRVYNKEKLSLFVSKDQDYEWRLCDYEIKDDK